MVNAWREPLEFELPPSQELPGGCWHRWLDTSLPSPDDIVPFEDADASKVGPICCRRARWRLCLPA